MAIFLGGLLIFSHKFFRFDAVTINDYLRAIMFVVIAVVVALLSEHASKAENILGERVKELNCLYGISKLVEKHDTSLDEILQSTTNLIRLSCQYPEVTCARIILAARNLRRVTFL